MCGSNLQTIVAGLKEDGAHVAAIKQPEDTPTATGKALCYMLGVFTDLETNLRRERQAEGIAAARQLGIRGRPPRINMAEIRERLSADLSPTEIARELDISRGTGYMANRELKDFAWVRKDTT